MGLKIFDLFYQDIYFVYSIVNYKILYKLISCGFDIKLDIIYLLSLKLFISSFNSNCVCNLPFFKAIL